MSNVDNETSAISTKHFLGAEFLTWLYFHLAEENWEVSIPEAFNGGVGDPVNGIVQFGIGSKVSLSHETEGANVSITGAYVDHGGEMFSAVKRGASIRTMQLVMAINSRVYTLTLESKNRKITAKLPDLFTDPNKAGETSGEGEELEAVPTRTGSLPLDAILDLRMTCLDEMEAVIDALYRKFIEKRVARQWLTKELAEIRTHVAERLA